MMAKKMSTEMAAIDRELSRINRQIKQAYKIFGSEGRLPEQYSTLLETRARGSLRAQAAEDAGLIRYDKNGVPQISRSTKALSIIQANKTAQRAVKQLGRMQTVQHAKESMLKAFEKRTGKTVGKSRQAKKEALQEEIKHYSTKQGEFNRTKDEMYKLETKYGIRFKAHDELKMMSKGHWTSDKLLQDMQDKVNAVLSGEDRRIQKNLLEGF